MMQVRQALIAHALAWKTVLRQYFFLNSRYLCAMMSGQVSDREIR